MSERPRIRAIVSDHTTGKTTAAAAWLLGGHLVPGWPGWSRALVVSSSSLVPWTVRHMPEVDRVLRERGYAPGLGKLVLSLGEVRRLRGVDRALELAVDDIDALLVELLGGYVPALVTMSADPVTTRQIHDEIAAISQG